jgi:hypothetical protein
MTATAQAAPDELPSLELVLEQVEKQLHLQWQHWEQVDGRLRLLLGFVGAIFVAILAFAGRGDPLPRAATGLALASISLLIASGVIAGLAWLPREFQLPPNPRALREDYVVRSVAETKLAVVDIMVEAYDKNQRSIEEKLGAFRSAAALFAAAVGLIAVAAAVALTQ